MKKAFLLFGSLLGGLCGFTDAMADNVYSIYPVPQEQVAGTGTVSLTQTVTVVCESSIDEITKKRIERVLSEQGLTVQFSTSASASTTNVYLGVNGSGEVADAKATALGVSRDVFSTEGKFDRHCLALAAENGNAELVILGEDTNATFFGIASLEQMLDRGTKDLPAVTIYDYADLQSRGIVEGYYGYPYSVSVKKDLMRFMMRYKMNTYLYGAKSDPYHSTYWSQAYPTSITAEQELAGWLSQDMVKELTEVSHDTKVNFIWAIHPGNSFLGSETVVSDIMGKFDKMYNLGVRQFAVFVDDVSIPSTEADFKKNADRLTELQRAIEAKYNVAGTAATDTVRPLHFVPQIYCTAFSSSEAQRQGFFEALAETPEYITIYTTGWGVWSVPNSGDLNEVRRFLGRNVGWWWNYPCNDNADAQIFPMDMYTNFVDMPSIGSSSTVPSVLNNGIGIVSNPMQEGEVAKTPLFSVADYAWNNSGFETQSSWEASFHAVLKDADAAAAYRTIAPYLRSNDPTELATLISSYKSSVKNGRPAPEALQSKMTELRSACETMLALQDSETESDRLLYHDLAPWLNKLYKMTGIVGSLLTTASMDNEDAQKWTSYVAEVSGINGLDTEDDYKVAVLEGMGSNTRAVYLTLPSNKNLYPFVSYLKENALDGYFEVPAESSVATNKDGVRATITSSASGQLYMTLPPVSLAKGEYVGLSLSAAYELRDFVVDASLLNDFSLLYSADGKSWKSVKAAGELPEGYVKHIVFVNDNDEAKSLVLNKTKFNITIPAMAQVQSATIPSGSVWDGHDKEYIFDGDYTTFCTLNRNQQVGDAYQLTLKTATPVNDVRVYIGTTNGDYMNGGKVQVSADGSTWTDLVVKGTSLTTFNMNMTQVKDFSDEAKYIDFSGTGVEAKYVRLYVSNANTSKWLRLYEIEVNKQSIKDATENVCTDARGNVIEELNDGLSYTQFVSGAKSLTYKFQQISLLKAVNIYQDARATAQAGTSDVKVSITDDGETWVEMGMMSDDICTIDLSAHSSAKAMKIEWTGASPAIYEIQEVSDEAQKPVISSIAPVQAVAGVSAEFKGKALVVSAADGVDSVRIYTAAGLQLMNLSCGGDRSVSVPLFAAAPGSLIVRVSTCKKQSAVYKLMVK